MQVSIRIPMRMELLFEWALSGPFQCLPIETDLRFNR